MSSVRSHTLHPRLGRTTPRRHCDEHDLWCNRVGTDGVDRARLQLLQGILGAFQERRKTPEVTNRLCDLSDRELMDIGTTRGGIDYVASLSTREASGPP